MPRYSVLVPIAGHILVSVEAASEEEAIDAALNSDDLNLDNAEDWEALDEFTSGNVCFCPHPWKVTATLEEE